MRTAESTGDSEQGGGCVMQKRILRKIDLDENRVTRQTRKGDEGRFKG